MKKIICLILTVLVLFSMSGCSERIAGAFMWFLVANDDDRAAKEDIFAFVSDNEDALRKAIADNDYTAFAEHEIIKDVYANERVVDFYCGGYGMGAESAYVGFCYIPDNNITAVPGMPANGDLIKPSGAGFVYEEGDNRFYAERICENFYYYEASY